MRKIQSYALMTAMAIAGTATFTACSSTDPDEEKIVYDDNGTAGVKSEFVISIPRKVLSITRQGDGVTQSDGTVDQFRGIDNIRLVPFDREPRLTSSRIADILQLSSVNTLKMPGQVNYKVYADQFVPIGTRYFLFYGRAIADEADTEITSMSDKFHYGILNVEGLTNTANWSPNDIIFSLEQINKSAAAQAGDATGANIVQLLNDLARISASGAAAPNNKWSTSTNIVLATLYKKFICMTTASSNTLAAVLSKLYYSLEQIPATDPARPLADAIKAKILTACASTPVNGESASLNSSYAGYPGNLGLPDGAVRVHWNGGNESFTDVTAEYGKGYSLKITDYCYPAALWYYAKTPLKAANETKSALYDTATSWEGVIGSLYSGTSDEVVAGTRSVALTKASEYGVGRLQTRIKMESGTFYDASGNEVNVGSGFKMKGLLLGGQNSVGYDFTPNGAENLTIYDSDITNNIIAKPDYTTTGNQTLALETESGQVIYAALELVNGGDEFMGADGLIPAGGTFYLTVRLDPEEAINKNEVGIDQIIKQDYLTELTITIKNGGTAVDRNGDGKPDVYVKDGNGVPIGVDTNGDGEVDPYDIDGDGRYDTFITDPDHGGPGWDTNGDGDVDIPVVPDEDGNYPDSPTIPDGLGSATNGVPDMTSPGVEVGTSVNLEWKQGLVLNPSI